MPRSVRYQSRRRPTTVVLELKRIIGGMALLDDDDGDAMIDPYSILGLRDVLCFVFDCGEVEET